MIFGKIVLFRYFKYALWYIVSYIYNTRKCVGFFFYLWMLDKWFWVGCRRDAGHKASGIWKHGKKKTEFKFKKSLTNKFLFCLFSINNPKSIRMNRISTRIMECNSYGVKLSVAETETISTTKINAAPGKVVSIFVVFFFLFCWLNCLCFASIQIVIMHKHPNYRCYNFVVVVAAVVCSVCFSSVCMCVFCWMLNVRVLAD